jgi:cytosine deaminase
LDYKLVIKNARIDDKMPLVDIGIENGKIAKIGTGLSGDREIDVQGDVVTPSFMESHIHLTKALLDKIKPNLEGTLAGAISITGSLKRNFEYDEVRSRTMEVLDMLLRHGTTYIRAEPDTDPLAHTITTKVMLDLKKEYKDYADIQVVAFAQEGLIKSPGAYDILDEAMKMGSDVVGGCPYNEKDFEDTKKHIDMIFELGKKYNKPVDFHADFGDNIDDMRYRSIDYIIDKTLDEGYQGRVSAGHVTSLSSVPPNVLEDTIKRLAEAKITMIPLPATDLFLSGRGDENKVRRGVLNPHPFVKGGVNIVFASNNIRNAFTPFGRGDLLLIGAIYEHVAQLGTIDDQKLLLDMITKNPAKLFGVEDTYGLEEGKNADLNVLGTKNLSDIFLDVPTRQIVMKRGKIIYRSELAEHKAWVTGEEHESETAHLSRISSEIKAWA